jgi:hypothetical protein
MALIQLPIDEQKLTAFRTLEKKCAEIEKRKNDAEKAQREAHETYQNAKAGAVRNMNSWEALGPLHVIAMQRTFESEKLQAEASTAATELQAAKPVLVEEIVRAARDLIK